MGFTPAQVGETGLSEFMAAWRGWRRFHIPERDKPLGAADAKALHAEIFGED